MGGGGPEGTRAWRGACGGSPWPSSPDTHRYVPLGYGGFAGGGCSRGGCPRFPQFNRETGVLRRGWCLLRCVSCLKNIKKGSWEGRGFVVSIWERKRARCSGGF